MKRFFSYDKENKVAKAEVLKKGIKGVGYAKAHPDDFKYANEITGLQLAELRATKDFLEKRARRKLKTQKRLLAEAQYMQDLAGEDLLEAEDIQKIIEQIISDKAALYEKLNNPMPKVQWTELTEDLMSDEFKLSLEGSGAVETETQGTVD